MKSLKKSKRFARKPFYLEILEPRFAPADVAYFMVTKGQEFDQTGTGSPVAETYQYHFSAQINETSLGSVTSATVVVPSSVGTLTLNTGGPSDTDFDTNQSSLSSKTTFDSQYPTGSYSFTIVTAHDGTKTPTITLPGDDYPTNAPHVTDYAAAQSISPTQDFTFTWDAFSGAAANTFIYLEIDDGSGNTVYTSPNFGTAGALNKNSTSFVIPSYTLTVGTTYYAVLMFANAPSLDTTSYPGATGIPVYFKQTHFTITTTGTVPDVSQIQVIKGEVFDQTGTGAPVPDATTPYVFNAQVEEISNSPDTVNSASVQLPNSNVLPLTLNGPDTEDFRFKGSSTVKSTFDTTYPTGTYTFTISTVHNGTKYPTLTLGSDNYPTTTPHITDYAAAQNITAASDFTLTWDSFSGGTANNHVYLEIDDAQGNDKWDSDSLTGSDALTGTSTQVLIPAGTLVAGQTYKVKLEVGKGTDSINVTGYSGVEGITGYYKQTDFTITTAAPPAGTLQLDASNYSVGEDGTSVPITVTRTNGSTGDASVYYTTSDGVGTTGAIAGTNYTTTSGTLSWLDGDSASKTFIIPVLNDSTVDPSKTFNVTLSDATGAVLGSTTTGVVTVLDSSPPQLALSSSTYAVQENAGTATITVTRLGTIGISASVHYATSDGSATAGTNYTTTSNTLNFAAGETSKTFSVPILIDGIVDPDLTVNLSLSSPSSGMGATLGSQSTAVLTIHDVSAGQLQFSSPTYSAPDNGGTMVITVSRASGSDGAASVHYATSNGSAIAGTNYTATTGTLTWAAGDSASKTFSIHILDNNLVASDKTINLTLSSASGAMLGSPTTSVLTIIENAQLEFSSSTYSMIENGGTATITVNRVGSTSQMLNVNYATSSGTAVVGVNYTPTSGTLTFGTGVTSQTFTVPVIWDDIVTSNKTVNLTLSNVTCATGPATLGSPSTAVLTVLNIDLGTPSGGGTLVSQGIFLDTDNDLYTVKLTGPGIAHVYLNDPDGDGRGPLDHIDITGTNSTSALSVTVKKAKTGSDGIVTIGSITSTGSLKSISISSSDIIVDDYIVDGIIINGTVGTIKMRDLLNGADISIGTDAGVLSPKLSLTLRNVGAGSAITSAIPITTLQANSILSNSTISAPSIGTLSVKAGSLLTDLSSTGRINSIKVTGGAASGAWSAASFGTISISGGGFTGSLTTGAAVQAPGIKTPLISSLTISGGNLNAPISTLGNLGTVSVKKDKLGNGGSIIGANSITAQNISSISADGSLSADITATGKLSSLLVKNGAASGTWSAATVGKVSVTGGNFAASLTATATPVPGSTTALISSVTITGGNLTGQINTLGNLGTVTLKKSSLSVGGNVIGSDIAAKAISQISIAGNLQDSYILAGASLGANHVFGGGDDSFGSGIISSISVLGSVLNSVVGAGLDPGTDGLFKTGDDVIQGGTASAIKALTVGGTLDATAYFGAGSFPATVKIGGVSVTPASDPHFLVN